MSESEVSKYHPQAEKLVKDRFGESTKLTGVFYSLLPKPGEFSQVWGSGHTMKPGDSFTIYITGIYEGEES